ncbi:MAG: patatin-like phospholipase family protein [Candidatus Nanoarchaeia archaeon]|nr:patatin-like phospholipase family protein [Candidatus Nanoarchaeia archaeon]
MARKKKVEVLMSAGAAKGFAHLGVLKALEEHNIPIDLIIGTSMGSLVGACYSIVPKADYWIKKLAEVTPLHLFDLNDFKINPRGLMTGNSLQHYIEKHLGISTFRDTIIPLIINSADLVSNKSVKFTRGKISDAVRASGGIPLIFDVVRQKNKLLVDGFVIDPIGIKWLKGKYDLVIVVNVNTANDNLITEKSNAFDILLRSVELMQRELVHEKIKCLNNAVLIEPNMNGLRYTDFHRAKEFVERGYAAGKKVIKQIKKYL